MSEYRDDFYAWVVHQNGWRYLEPDFLAEDMDAADRLYRSAYEGRVPKASDVGHYRYAVRIDVRDPMTVWPQPTPPEPVPPPEPEPEPAEFPATLADVVAAQVGYDEINPDTGRQFDWFPAAHVLTALGGMESDADLRRHCRWLRSRGLNATWGQCVTARRPVMNEESFNALNMASHVHRRLDICADEGVAVLLEACNVEVVLDLGQKDSVSLVRKVVKEFGGHPNVPTIRPWREMEKVTGSKQHRLDWIYEGLMAVLDGWGRRRNGRPVTYHAKSDYVPATGFVRGDVEDLVWGVHVKLSRPTFEEFTWVDDGHNERETDVVEFLDYWLPNRRRVLGGKRFAGATLEEFSLPHKSTRLRQNHNPTWGDGLVLEDCLWRSRRIHKGLGDAARKLLIADCSMGGWG